MMISSIATLLLGLTLAVACIGLWRSGRVFTQDPRFVRFSIRQTPQQYELGVRIALALGAAVGVVMAVIGFVAVLHSL